MARESQDREDLLRDATAFVNRLQLRVEIDEKPSEVFVGFRRGGAVSLYLDQDPVYHFNGRGELRRAFFKDQLIKAEQGKLVGLDRQNSDEEVAMLRREFSPAEQELFCEELVGQFQMLLCMLKAGDFVVEGQVAEDEGTVPLEQLMHFLNGFVKVRIADSPRVGG